MQKANATKSSPSSPSHSPSSSSPRRAAWRCLLRWAEGKTFAETLIEQETRGFASSDRAMVQAIVLGTLRNLRWLKHLRRCLRSASLEEKAEWLVLSGLCQLFLLHHAEHAAVCETVNAAPRHLKGLVNGMLRQAIRRKSEFLAEKEKLPPGVRYSTPDWLVERWEREWGRVEVLQLLEWNTQAPLVYARINPLHPPQKTEWYPLPELPGWFRLTSGLPLEDLREGSVYVADPSTRHCIRLLAPHPGERILDACAAPGGKSAAILGETMGEVHLLATDAEEHRLQPLRENLERAGGSDVQVLRYDWTQPCPEEWTEAFDAVLLDVPCSNSGVLQRRVDARWRLTEKEMDRLAALQGRILAQASQAVRPGGRLVYSTCSIDRQEDQAVVEAFLEQHGEFSLAEDYLALPHREQADGAYAALLLRKKADASKKSSHSSPSCV